MPAETPEISWPVSDRWRFQPLLSEAEMRFLYTRMVEHHVYYVARLVLHHLDEVPLPNVETPEVINDRIETYWELLVPENPIPPPLFIPWLPFIDLIEPWYPTTPELVPLGRDDETLDPFQQIAGRIHGWLVWRGLQAGVLDMHLGLRQFGRRGRKRAT